VYMCTHDDNFFVKLHIPLDFLGGNGNEL